MEKIIKIIRLKNIQKAEPNPNDLLSVSKCTAILQNDGSTYTDQEVLIIREFLYKLADLDYELFLAQQKRELEFQLEQINEAA